MIPEIKDYNDVLVLARGLTDETVKQLGDGFQTKDLAPIFSANFQQAIAAFEGASNVATAWKTHTDACVELTVEFAVDMACDLMKVPAGSASEFKETQEVLNAVSGLVASIAKHAQGGFQPGEYFEVAYENFNAITVAVDGADKIAVEFKADARAFIKLVALFAVKFAFGLKAALAPKAG
jgi:hypothetical protein